MMRYLTKALAACLLLCGVAQAGTIDISLATVGEPGNVADPATGYGAVPYTYDIGTYDVTMSQYATFLNAVATSGDPYGVCNSSMAAGYPGLPTDGISQISKSSSYAYSVVGNGNVPVTDLSWGDAARFVNWLQNGQPTAPEGPGTTETGTYALDGGTSNTALMAVSRSATASWVLPTLNEWYKSAYYSGGGTNSAYWLYATQSNSTPSNVLSATGTNNANYLVSFVGPPTFGATDYINYVTPVGAFADSPSHYGTFDQNGDVWQWNETAYDGNARGIYGGSYADTFAALHSTEPEGTYPTYFDRSFGFRAAYLPSSVPEPRIMPMLASAAAILLFLRRQRLIRHCRGVPMRSKEVIPRTRGRAQRCEPIGPVTGD